MVSVSFTAIIRVSVLLVSGMSFVVAVAIKGLFVRQIFPISPIYFIVQGMKCK